MTLVAHLGTQCLTVGHRGQNKNYRIMKNARRARLVIEDDVWSSYVGLWQYSRDSGSAKWPCRCALTVGDYPVFLHILMEISLSHCHS